ncbi:MAG TPA: BadF/BadG/BcrA/BcrD ATPase family protein [Phototrophicaceae bacterium]|jgi:N-acetylglucosamine kinase-like BadF-type ATPase|nr:BadF/BadG/BcrA/BcrD ATPase family protein [Phototrophicaceae bacterium]
MTEMQAQYFLGVDIGATKSHALITDADGQVIGFGRAGSGNHESVGTDGFAHVLQTIVRDALNEANLISSQISGAGFGIAGYDWDSDQPLMRQTIGLLDLNCPYAFVNDAVIGLIAGAQQGWGVALSAGTSCNCCGRTLDGREGRMTGNGIAFGEYGGGGELVMWSVQQISRAWSLRAPQTRLTDIFVQAKGAKDATDLLEGMARGRFYASAADAPLVFEAIKAGDAVALEGLRWISHELAGLAAGVIRQLNLESERFEIVLAGSFYNGSPLIEQILNDDLHVIAPGSRLVRLNAAPVVGGVILGMQQVNLHQSQSDFKAIRVRVIDTANRRIS